jgi:hypothetical protein
LNGMDAAAAWQTKDVLAVIVPTLAATVAISEVGALIDVDERFVRRCAKVIQQASSSTCQRISMTHLPTGDLASHGRKFSK